MKTLYIVRHAKSSWNFPELSDEERPLLEKGKKRTRKIIEFLREKEVSLDQIISSHAVRALETARIIGHALEYSPDDIIISRQIYHATADQLFDQFFDMSDEVENVMIVGPNPTLTNFANLFLDDKIEWLPTSGVVSISFDTNIWINLPATKGKTNFIVYPKML